MQAAADFRQERHELDTILASGILNRAPNLAQLLTYVCAKYFEGAAEQIKEYNIAVEALGRPADFDQKRDSIVRVEAHRLRKRLREYYEADGADHAIRIDIPPGQYAPRFLAAEAPLPSLSAVTLVAQGEPGRRIPDPATVETDTQLAPPVPRPSELVIPAVASGAGYRMRNAAIVTMVLLISAAAAARPLAHSGRKPPQSCRRPCRPWWPRLPTRSRCGSWRGARMATTPTAWAGSGRATGIFKAAAYLNPTTIRYSARASPRSTKAGAKALSPTIFPLPAGVYELRLHFAETLYGENNVAGGGESSRVFNVWINGKEALHEFDVIGEAGPSTADVRAFKDISPAADGKLHLKFEPFSNPPLLSAIEIVPGIPGKLRPIRMLSLDRVYVDKQGRVWEPDRYARGGQLIARTNPVEGAADPELFRGERFGNLRYVIPVPPGRYGVTFYFAEAWFGPDTPGGRRRGQPGVRYSVQRRGAAPRLRCLQRGARRRARRDVERSRTGARRAGKAEHRADTGSQLRLRECGGSVGRIEVGGAMN